MSTPECSSINALPKDNSPAHVKNVKQMFERAKQDDGVAPAGITEKRRVTMSSTIELLQKKIHAKEESDQGRAGKSSDLKQPKLQAARPKCTWTTDTLSGVARKRSRSRFSSATKKIVVTTGPVNKKERPYRQWLGVSHCVTTDTKFIISSKPSRHSLERDTLPANKGRETMTTHRPPSSKSSRNGSKSPESIIDDDRSTSVVDHQGRTSHSRRKTPVVCDEGAIATRETPVENGLDDNAASSKCMNADELISSAHEMSDINYASMDNNQISDTIVGNSPTSENRTFLEDSSKSVHSSEISEKCNPTHTTDQENTITISAPSTIGVKSGICPLGVSVGETEQGLKKTCGEGISLNKPSEYHNMLRSADGDNEGKCLAESLDYVDNAVTEKSFARTENDRTIDLREATAFNANSYKVDKKSLFLKNKELSFDRASSVDTGEIPLSDLSWQEFTDDESLESESCFKVNFASAVKGHYQPTYPRVAWRTRTEKSSSLKSRLYPKFENGCRADFSAGKRDPNRVPRKKATSLVACMDQNTSTPPHSTAETSYIKGLSTPEIKRKPSSISPHGHCLPSSKRPLLRTEARACQRSRQQSPCTNNAESLANIRWTPLCTPKTKQHNVCKMSENMSTKTVCSIGTETERGQICELGMLQSSSSKMGDYSGSKKTDSLRKTGNKVDSLHLPKHKKHKSVGAMQLLQKINWTSKHGQKPDYILVQAVMDYRGTLPGQLSFRKGQVIRQRREAEAQASDMCYGSYSVGRLKKKRKGLFPAYCVVEISPTS